MTGIKGKGRAYQWLLDHVAYPHDYCLIWPFSLTRGYGAFGHMGQRGYAHRVMCRLVHGDPPTTLHEAAHSCGRGDEGCVNPNHLSWKTKSANQMDCRKHGTQAKSCHGPFGKLTAQQVAVIRASDKPQCDIARQFGVHETTISNIRTGRTWTKTRDRPQWTEEDIQKLRNGIAQKTSIRILGAELGRTPNATRMYMRRVGGMTTVTPAICEASENKGGGAS
jgi:hypothetical protein